MADEILPDDDLLIEVWPQRKVGGQIAGVPRVGVKITHKPTGLVVMCAIDRSQHRNKQIAMDMLLGGLTSPKFNEYWVSGEDVSDDGNA